MAIDILILEDDPRWCSLFEERVKAKGLEYITFNSGLQALEYLRTHAPDNLPRGYLVDMRIESEAQGLGMSLHERNRRELESPLAIYRLLQSYNATQRFRFVTGHFSEHDEYVQGITSAQVILKMKIEKLDEFLEELKSSK